MSSTLLRPLPLLAAARRAWIVLAGAAAMGFLLGGCGAVGDACLFDSDCSGGSLCVREMCRAACTSEADCEPPEDQCLAVTRERTADKETVKVCVDERFNADPNGSGADCKARGDCCTRDAECVELYDDDRARCGHDARCLIPVS